MPRRVCDEVRSVLPAYVGRSLPKVRRALVRLHLRRCRACQAEFSRQREVLAGLRALSSPAAAPPDGLLESLLESTASPRGAVPMRGAVSGARPALSLALLAAGAAAGTGVGYASWLSARSVRRRLRG